MKLRSVFRGSDDKWRTGWRMVTMFALLAVVVIGLNVGWKALGLPGQQESGPWFFLLLASLISGAALGVIALLLRFFENRGLAAIGMPFVADAWKKTAAGTVLGAAPICLLLGLAVLGGLGRIRTQGLPASAAVDWAESDGRCCHHRYPVWLDAQR